MSDIYTSTAVVAIGQNRRRDEDRLSPRAAAVAIFALAILAWVPVLLPIVALLHR
jgi:hypothetical protein